MQRQLAIEYVMLHKKKADFNSFSGSVFKEVSTDSRSGWLICRHNLSLQTAAAAMSV